MAFEIDAGGRSLAEVLVADALGGDALPLLQMTLQRLYEAQAQREKDSRTTAKQGDDSKSPQGLLLFADYPGMGAAVTRTAEEAYGKLDAAAKSALPALLTAFVRDVDITLERGQSALVILPVVREAFERGRRERSELVQAFVACRLLTVEDTGGVVRVRPVHEALLRVWPEAVRIIEDNAALIRVRRTLEPMVADWSQAVSRAKRGYLVTAPPLLAGAAQLAARMGDELSESMRAFIADSLAEDAARRDAEKNRQRKVLAATASGLVVAIVLATLAVWQWHLANVQRDRAENAVKAAIKTANSLIIDQARAFRDRVGMPNELVRDILDRSQKLQDELIKSGEISPDMLFSAALSHEEILLTMLQQSTSKAQADVNVMLGVAQRFRSIMEGFVSASPNNIEWQYELSLSHNRLGDVSALAARYQDALDEYFKSRAIREALVAADPGNVRWQEPLATAFEKIGDMLRELGRVGEALTATDQSLAIRQRLVDLDQADANRQRELAVSYERRGLALGRLGRLDDALDAFTKSLNIRQRLAADKSNAQWQRDLSVSYERIGDYLKEIGKIAQALTAYRECFAIRQTLAIADPDNTERQRDLSVAYSRIGNTEPALGQREEGLDALRKSLAIREKLTRDDPGNALWQADLVIALRTLGLAGDEARPRLSRALEIARRLQEEDKLGADRRGWVGQLEQDISELPN
jgi:tetratricopeptide (TPR) repeat protein